MSEQGKGGGFWSWLRTNFDWMGVLIGGRLLHQRTGDGDPLKSSDDEFSIVAILATLRDGTPLGEARYRVAKRFIDYMGEQHFTRMAVVMRQLLSREKDPAKASKRLSSLLGAPVDFDAASAATDEQQLAQLRGLLANPEQLELHFKDLIGTLEVALKSPLAAVISDRFGQLKEWNNEKDKSGAEAAKKLRDKLAGRS